MCYMIEKKSQSKIRGIKVALSNVPAERIWFPLIEQRATCYITPGDVCVFVVVHVRQTRSFINKSAVLLWIIN